MAFKIIWSRQAHDDLRDIIAFIAERNQPVAELFGFRLIAKVDLLAEFPELGRSAIETSDKNIRELIFPPYRIIYRVMSTDRTIAIVRVWHGARDEPEISGSREV